MTDMQTMDDSPENFSVGNSALNHTSSNMRSSNYYYKAKNSSSMKLENVKEDTTFTAIENGIDRLLKDPKQVRKRDFLELNIKCRKPSLLVPAQSKSIFNCLLLSARIGCGH
jgi:hypothetical protein